jgi:hypothetical protein
LLAVAVAVQVHKLNMEQAVAQVAYCIILIKL